MNYIAVVNLYHICFLQIERMLYKAVASFISPFSLSQSKESL